MRACCATSSARYRIIPSSRTKLRNWWSIRPRAYGNAPTSSAAIAVAVNVSWKPFCIAMP